MMRSSTVSVGTAAILAINRIPLLKSSPTHGVFMTCTAMCGNGARIGTGITPQSPLQIPKDPHRD